MNRHHQRGAIGVAMLAALVIVELIIVVSVVGGRLQQDLTMQRIDTNRAFYAAEGGMAMAVREEWLSQDLDGDGVIGGISDDGNDANNPAVGAATVVVTATAAGSQSTLEATGSADRARRRVELLVTSQ